MAVDPVLDYYLAQSGRGLPFPVFAGPGIQRRFAGIFSSLLRFIRPVFQAFKPIARKILPTVGRELARAGTGLVTDVVSGENMASSAKKRFASAGESLRDQAIEGLTQAGSGRLKRKKGVKRLQFAKRLRRTRTKEDIFQ